MYYCLAMNKYDPYTVLTGFQIINQTQTIFLPPLFSGLPKWLAIEPGTKGYDFDFWMQVIYDLQNEKVCHIDNAPTGKWIVYPIPDECQPLIAAKQDPPMFDWADLEAAS